MIGNKRIIISNQNDAYSVKNIEELKKLDFQKLENQKVVITSGYYNENDFGGSKYYFDLLSSEPEDGFLIIEPNNGVGRFKLIFETSLNINCTGVLSDGITDDSSKIQNAIDFISSQGGGSLILNNETYGILSPIVLKSYVKLTSNNDKQVYLPTNRPELKALTGFPANQPLVHMGNGTTERRGIRVEGIAINGGLIADYGIVFSDTIQAEIIGNLFLYIKNGGAALRGGGALYLNIEKNSFSTGDFYALDSQNSYAIGVGHYYGINVGNFSKNNVVCTYGVRFEGILDIYENDFEGKVKQRSCIDINSASANSYVNIFNNYFEIGKDVDDLKAIRCTYNSGVISGNRIYGDNTTNSIAIDIGSNVNYSISVFGNQITNWQNGIKSFPSNSGHGENIINYTIGSNFYNIVANKIINSNNSTSVSSVLNNGDFRHSAQLINNANYHHFQGALSLGGCRINYATIGSLNLVKGNLFKLIDTTPVTISSITNKVKGFVFTIYASTGGVVTLPNSQFNLASGQNLILPAYRPILFEVDYDGIIREIGITSSLITNGTAPVDEVTHSGFIDIDGKKIKFYL